MLIGLFVPLQKLYNGSWDTEKADPPPTAKDDKVLVG